MAKNITFGAKYRSLEERLWQRNFVVNSFEPSSRIGKTYMLKLYVIAVWMNIADATNGNTKLFKLDVSVEI